MRTSELSGEVVTYWFTDIERSTRLLQALGDDAFTSVLEDHNKILGDIVGSALVSTEGDSFFCVFRSALEAVDAAAATQRQIATHSWPDGGRVRIRIGMHSGPARLGGADFVGLDVHRAARISAAGHGGQVLMSDVTRALVQHELPEGIALIDLGEHRLKDLLQPQHLFQLSLQGLQDAFPPIVAKGSGEVRIPEPATEFVGREAEVRKLIDALANSRLVTVVGLGGVGKTRLAVRAIRDGGFEHEGSVFFVGLADSSEASSVAKTAAESISLSEQAGRPVEETLIDYLNSRTDLLIFDNCEHLIEEVAGLLQRLLQTCPDLRILATSREPLLIDGEQIINLAPMSTVAGSNEATGSPSDAVRLFAARASAAAPDFDLAQWGEEVDAICRRLDGIPLAIELAAARIPLLTPTEILELLEDRFSLLTTRKRGADPRHQTLEATLDWSYELLEPELQQLLCRLAVFRGGFSREAAEEVCFDDLDSRHVLDLLTSLHERSLLQRSVVSAGTRFHLLETVGAYARRKLEEESGEESAALVRHRAYFLEFARDQTSRLGGNDQLEALDLLETDHDNVREVIDQATTTGDLDVAADLAGRLAWFWYVHGHFREGERRAESLLERLPDRPNRPWLRLLIASAQFDYRLGFFERAEHKLVQAIEHSSKSGEARLEMWARAYAATNDVYRMEIEDGRKEARRALALAEQEGDLIAFGYSRLIEIGGEAAMLEFRGELTADRAAELRAAFQPLTEIARNLAERNLVGHVLELEGILSFRSGDIGGAASSLDRSIVALTELGTIGCGCHCLEAIAFCVAEHGMLEPAVTLIGASDGLREMVGVAVSPMEEPFRQGTLKLAAETWSDDRIASVQRQGRGFSSREAMQVARDVVARLHD